MLSARARARARASRGKELPPSFSTLNQIIAFQFQVNFLTQ